MNPIGLWASFFLAIRDYQAFLQDAVDRGVSARSDDGEVFVHHKKTEEELQQCIKLLEQKYWLSPLDGDLLELENYCTGHEYPVESLIQAAIWFQTNKLRKKLHKLGVTGEEADSVKRAIQYEFTLDERQKVIEKYLYAISLDRWYQEVKKTKSEKKDKKLAAKQRKSRGAKRTAIEFIKERVTFDTNFSGLLEMKQGKNFKDILAKLFAEFQAKEPELSKSITKPETFYSYVTDALNEINPSRKQTSD